MRVYNSLRHCIEDLDRQRQLLRIKEPVDPYLEMAEIHRRIHAVEGPAIFFEHLKGCKFPALSNLYGTKSRVEYLFKDAIPLIKILGRLKNDPSLFYKNPLKYLPPALKARFAIPSRTRKTAMIHQCQIQDLPKIVSWPKDGGPFILLPQVFTLPPGSKKILDANLGMYRIQLSGNHYQMNEEIGLHYQLHRGIGVHHTQYLKSNEPFKASIFVGGPPSQALSAIFPLPENLSELTFAGLLNGKRFNYSLIDGHYISNQADFVITGTIGKNLQKPEGPFGDHLGYYSLQHDFPVMKVDKVYHSDDPIWHFTVVGRPPQEDSYFGYLIHEIVKDLVPIEFPGLRQLHAVDAAGVHPLLLAIGQERYMPFREKRPEEILTIAHRILGSGQTSLAKYLIILAEDKDHLIDSHDYETFFEYFLTRVRWERDLHFTTNTTIDTLDYSGEGWNAGSKVVMACCGEQVRMLSSKLPERLNLTAEYEKPLLFFKGVLCIQAPKFINYEISKASIANLISSLEQAQLDEVACIVLCDDPEFVVKDWNNFLWVTFTRSNPSHDIYGVGAFTSFKHWGCKGPLIIDARIKPHHAPILESDPEVVTKVDKLFAKGGSLFGYDRIKQK